VKLAVVVEGDGDQLAFPCLVARTGEVMGMQIFAPDPIMCRGFHKLSQPGQLERFVRLAAQRPDADAVLVVVDLDDGCAANSHHDFAQRADAIAAEIGKDVRICFCVREYECWFLNELDTLKAEAPEYGWVDGYSCVSPHEIRGAKGYLNRGMARHYKETIDQLSLTRRLNIRRLYGNSRSFRKFVRSMTGFEYDILDMAFA
jgi:hypothetical protein